MYKIILLTFLISSNIGATIIFLDTNNNNLEIKAAKEQAISQGEKFLSYPPVGEAFDSAVALKLVEDNKASTVFLSGHNGGGTISGDQGQIDRSDFVNYLAKNKNAFDSIKVLGLLGCNTASHSEILAWKNFMPNLNFIAGYDGSAPSQKWVQGRKYIQKIIAKKDAILKETEEKEIEKMLKGFSNMDTLQVTLFVDSPVCSDPSDYIDQYIYRPLTTHNKKFDIFLDKNCKEKIDKFSEYWIPLYESYISGEVEIPEDTSSGPLRDLYSYVRQNEHCFEGFYEFPNGNQVLFLLFFEDFFKNFNTYYEKHLINFFDELKQIGDSDSLDENRKKRVESINKQKVLLSKYIKNPNLLRLDLKDRVIKAKKELKSYPKSDEWHLVIQDFVDSWQPGNMESYEGFLADKSQDFKSYIYAWGTLKHLNESLENFNTESATVELKDMLESIDYDLSEINSDEEWAEKKKELIESYSKLNVKNAEDFKLLSKKELNVFNNYLHSFDAEDVFERTEFMEDFKDIISSRLNSVSDFGVNFNWHDANLGFPMDPSWGNNKDLDESYLKSHSESEKDKVYDFLYN